MEKNKIRESNFELLRIIAMFCIILYHVIYFFVWPLSGNDAFYRAIQIPLHIGVPLFVLISGYFCIRPSFKGLLLLLLPVLVYYTPLGLVTGLLDNNYREAAKSILFFSHGPYWYVRTYVYLYLCSPLLNLYFDKIKDDNRQQLITFVILSSISCYMGIVGGDQSLAGGTNIINFTLIYFVGYLIRQKVHLIKEVETKRIIASYIALNILIVSVFLLVQIGFIQSLIIKTCFLYCSPILLLNAGLLFVLFERVRIHNKRINNIARSTYAMYILHHQPFILYTLIGGTVAHLYTLSGGGKIITLLGSVFITLIIMILSYFMDMLLRPLYVCIVSCITNRKSISFLTKR